MPNVVYLNEIRKFEVIVSNVGTVYTGNNEEDAKRNYAECVDLSKNNYGRFANESVTMFCNDEIIAEHTGENEG